MNCSNCGTFNNEGSKFCIRCGNNLTLINQPTSYQPINNTQVVEPTSTNINLQNSQPISNEQVNNTQSVSNEPLSYFMYLIAVLLKPIQTFKEEESKLSNTKTSIIFSIVVAGIIMVVNLLKSMFSVVMTKTLDYSTFKYKTSFEFSNLKDLDYLSLIGKNFLIYLAIIFAIAGVYYLGSLIIKKSISFAKMLSVSSTSVVPYVVLGMVLSPILSKIWAPLGIVATVVGMVYSVLIFFNLINKDITFVKSDSRIYFNLSCLSILAVSGYYIYIKFLTSNITDQLSNYLDLFK